MQNKYRVMGTLRENDFNFIEHLLLAVLSLD